MSGILGNERGAIAIMFAILMPFLVYILWLGFDGSSMLAKHSRLDDASREANLASSTLKDKDKKEEVAQKFLYAYFDEKTEIKPKEFEDLVIKDENSSKKAVKLSSHMSDTTFYKPNAEIEQSYKLDANSIIGEGSSGKYGGNTDYAFAIDFSKSMSQISEIFLKDEIKRLCADTDGEDYDKSFCSRMQKEKITNLDISQAVVHKILKILAKYSSDTVTYSMIPFSNLTQASRRHSYTIGSSYPQAKQLITPYVMKPRYRLSNMAEYDRYSRAKIIDVKGGKFVFPELQDTDPNKEKIEDFLTRIIAYSTGFDSFNTRFSHALHDVVDYKASIDRMFDLNAGFGFRFTASDVPKDLIWYVKFERSPPYTNFPKVRTLVDSRSGDFLAAETPLKPLEKIDNYDEEPVKDPDDLENLNSIVTDFSTDIMIGLMRGAAHLGRGKNSRRALLIITDAATNSSVATTRLSSTASNFIDYGVCDRVRDGLTKQGADKVEIFVFVIGTKSRNGAFIKTMTKCMDEKNIIFVENLESFFKDFKKAALGEGTSPNFIYEKLK